MAECQCKMVASPVVKVYRLKEARRRNIQPLRPLLTKAGSYDSNYVNDDDTDSGIGSHSNTNGSISSSDLSKSEVIDCLSSASLKNPAYFKAKILWDFQSSRPGTELSVNEGEIVYLLYRENDKILVINSEGKRGFVPVRYCSLLHKKVCTSSSARRPQTKLTYDTSYDVLSRNDRLNHNIIPNSLMYNPHTAPRWGQTGSVYHKQSIISSSSEEDSDYSFRGNSGVRSWSRKSPERLRERQKINASFFRKGEPAKMLVLYDFIARDENDISVYKGEVITVLNREDRDWWWIATTEGYEGFAPSAYLSRLSSVSSEGSTTSSSIESSSSTSDGSSTQGVRFQDPLCTFHRYEKEEWETDSEISHDYGYPVENSDREETGREDSTRWSTWC